MGGGGSRQSNWCQPWPEGAPEMTPRVFDEAMLWDCNIDGGAFLALLYKRLLPDLCTTLLAIFRELRWSPHVFSRTWRLYDLFLLLLLLLLATFFPYTFPASPSPSLSL